jgi:tRNA 2-thiocytidine biosynthesis protein TtcA
MTMDITSTARDHHHHGSADERRPTSADERRPTSADERRAAQEANKLSKRLHRLVGQAIGDYAMIEPGDKVMVCVSGGKDSYSLLDILEQMRRRAPVGFDIVAVNLDQKQPGFPADVLPAYLRERGVPFHIETRDTYSIVKRLVPEGQTLCSLCSRLRRGILYRVAGELGATKIALGHHRDDIVATLLMNMFFGGRLKGMPAKLVSDNGRHTVIRPLAYVAASDLEAWAAWRRFPIIPCTLCGSQPNLQRAQMNAMLREWDRQYPGRVDNIARSMAHITPSHLADPRLYPFKTIRPAGVVNPDGDRAFDDDEPCGTAGSNVSPVPITPVLSDVEGLVDPLS